MLVERLKHDFGETSAPFKNSKTKEEYRRIYGGYAHPGANPGFAIAIAELWQADQATGKRPYAVLAEASESNPSDLVRAAASITRSCQVECFFADDQDRAAMDLIRRQPYRIRLITAPFIGEVNSFETYLLMLRELTNPARKLLHFRGSQVPGVLSTIRSIDVSQSSKTLYERWPQVTAAGFCVAGLETRNHNGREDFMANMLNEELARIPDR